MASSAGKTSGGPPQDSLASLSEQSSGVQSQADGSGGNKKESVATTAPIGAVAKPPASGAVGTVLPHSAQTSTARSATPRRLMPWIVVLCAIAALFAMLFYVSDELLTPPVADALGASFDKDKFGQTIGQLSASIADSNINILVGLFVLTGFSLAFNSDFTKQAFPILVAPLSIFGVCSVLAVYFAIKWKLGLLEQIQFDRVNIDRIEMAFRCHMYALLGAALSSFAIVLIVLGAAAKSEGGDKR